MVKKSFFRDIELDVFNGVYDPAEDSFLLAENLEAGNRIRVPGVDGGKCKDVDGGKCKDVLDMGTGTGLLAIVAARQGAKVTGCDVNPTAVECAQKNAKKNSVDVKFIVSDLFGNVRGKYDLIVFNPPYVPSPEIENDGCGGGKQGREVIDRFMKDVDEYLKPGGSVLLLVSSLNEFERGRVIARKKLFFEELRVLELFKP